MLSKRNHGSYEKVQRWMLDRNDIDKGKLGSWVAEFIWGIHGGEVRKSTCRGGLDV